MKYLFIFVLFLFSQSCVQESQLSDADKLKVETEVKQMFENYFSDMAKFGFTAELKYLDSTPQFFWAPPGYSTTINFNEVKTILTENAPKFKSINHQINTLKIIPLTKNISTYTAKINSQMIDTSGSEIKLSLMESGVLIKRGENWKLLSGQTASIK